MSIEDITNPRVFKFLFDVADGVSSINTTGIVIRFLDAKLQDGSQLSVWAEMIPSCKRSKVECVLARTGDEVPREFQYVSTLHDDHDLVYHVYARSEMKK